MVVIACFLHSREVGCKIIANPCRLHTVWKGIIKRKYGAVSRMLHSQKRQMSTRSDFIIFDSLALEVYKYTCIHKHMHVIEKQYKLSICIYMHMCVCSVCMLKEQSITMVIELNKTTTLNMGSLYLHTPPSCSPKNTSTLCL